MSPSYAGMADDGDYPQPLSTHPPAAPEPPPKADSFVPHSPSGPPRDVDMNGRVVARGASRRRKPVSGSGSSPMSPQSPESPVAPHMPISYRDSYDDRQPGTKTFADRARDLAEEGTVLPSGNTPDPPRQEERAANTHRHSRTTSQFNGHLGVDRAIGRMPFADGPERDHEEVRRSTRYSRDASIDAVNQPRGVPVVAVAPPQRSDTLRGSANPQKVDWAVDHSPLQKLENDLLTKEKKRARVQQAEQRAKEKERARKERESQTSDGLLSPERASMMTEPRRKSKRESTLSRGLEEIGAPKPSAERARAERRVVSEPQATQTRMSRIPRPVDILADHGLGPSKTSQAGDKATRASLDSALPRRATDLAVASGGARRIDAAPRRRSVDDRGVRFPQNPVEATLSASKPGPNEPLRSNNQQTSASSSEPLSKASAAKAGTAVVAAAEAGAIASAVHAGVHGVHGLHKGPKYDLPPQTTAGGQARQAIGFGGISSEQAIGGTDNRHHFPHLHSKQAADAKLVQQPLRYLNEWRQGTTARLLVADQNAPVIKKPDEPQTAWWETPPSQRRSGSISQKQPDVAYFDGANEDGNRKFRSYLSEGVRFRDPEEAAGDGMDDGASEDTLLETIRDALNTHVVTLQYRFRQQTALEAIFQRSGDLNLSLVPLYSEHLRVPYLSNSLTSSPLEIEPTKFDPPLYLKCGPLLRYTGIKRENSGGGSATAALELWRGSVMIVTLDSESKYSTAPTLRLFHQHLDLLPPPPSHISEGEEPLPSEYVDPVAGLPKMARDGSTVYVKPAEDFDEGIDYSQDETDGGLFEKMRTANVPTAYGRPDNDAGSSPVLQQHGSVSRKTKSTGRFREVKGVRLHAERGVTFWRFNIEVELGESQSRIAYRINKGAAIGFWVPGRGQSMNMMFHSCNGFSASVNPNDFSGPDPLWRDVLNAHQTKPFHVMIGGGDQVYNDKVSEATTIFRDWLETKNPVVKRHAEFTPELRDELEDFYLNRYAMWFSHGLFGMANSQIPMVNVWDDHDIIDGYGSYSHSFMSTPIFCGLGTVAFKYYMLFQHQSVPDELETDEPSWLLGAGPGPYINFQSRSLFMSMGKHISFLGVDCRTERMRDEILSERTYDLIFDRCRREIVNGQTKHLIVLLGIPIAYPRLVWLENILTSRAMDPVKALGRLGMLGNLMNKFDGGYEILDDLDDHWTASHHKAERRYFIQELQDLAAEKSVRITILGGDVHLAAVGQFYSNKKLRLPKDRDFRYMPNIISSAIVNTPPPDMMADVLNKRDKVHHLDADTDEDMIPMFLHDVDGKRRNNKKLLPRRNWCSICEYHPGSTPPPTPPLTPTPPETPMSETSDRPPARRSLSLNRDIRPGNLLRRLSLSNKPVQADDGSSLGGDNFEKDGYFPPPSGGKGIFSKLQRNSSAPPPPTRPLSNFHRMPTDLSEKAAQKGGAELDLDKYISLEDGLDVRLNCEIKKGDPLGSTESYRLLVPALWHIEDAAPPPVSRRNSVMERINSLKAGPFARRRNRDSTGSFTSQDEPLGPDVTRGAMRAPAMFQPRPTSGLPIGNSVSVESLPPESPAGGKIRGRMASIRDKIAGIPGGRRGSDTQLQGMNDEFALGDDGSMMRAGRKSLPNRPPVSGSSDQVFYRPRRQSLAERVGSIGRRLSQRIQPRKNRYYSDDEYTEGSYTGTETESEEEDHPGDYIGSGDLARPGRQPLVSQHSPQSVRQSSGSQKAFALDAAGNQPQTPRHQHQQKPQQQQQQQQQLQPQSQPATRGPHEMADDGVPDPFKPRPKVAMSPPPQAQYAQAAKGTQAQYAQTYGSSDAMAGGNAPVQRTRSGRVPPQDNRRSGAVFRQRGDEEDSEDMSEDDNDRMAAGTDALGSMDSIDDLDSLKQVPQRRRKNIGSMLGEDAPSLASPISPPAPAGPVAGPRRKDMSKFFGDDVPSAGDPRRNSAGAVAGAAKRRSRGYDGIDAYSEGSKKWWQR